MIILKRIYEGLTLRHYIRTPSTGQGLQWSPPAQDPPLFLGSIRFSLRIETWKAMIEKMVVDLATCCRKNCAALNPRGTNIRAWKTTRKAKPLVKFEFFPVSSSARSRIACLLPLGLGLGLQLGASGHMCAGRRQIIGGLGFYWHLLQWCEYHSTASFGIRGRSRNHSPAC